MTEAKGKSDKCQKADAERERRRRKYKFALVKWNAGISGWENFPTIAIEYKKVLNTWWVSADYTILCDDQPERVLKGMLKLLREGENE